MATLKDLIVYKKAFNLAMEIFHITKKFPKEEIYAWPIKSGAVPGL
jgi:hypothetical protein